MNPFYWPGPDFLVFYLILMAATLGAQWWMRRAREAEARNTANSPKLNEPYLVSYLTGELNGMIRCITVTLLERNVLRVLRTGKKSKNELIADSGMAADLQSPVERAVARFFAYSRESSEVFTGLRSDPDLRTAAAQYRSRLEDAGLIATPEQRTANWLNAAGALLVLLPVAFIKMYVAKQTGHHNIAFLVILTFAAVFASLLIAARRKTVLAKEAVQDLRHLFEDVRQRTRQGVFDAISPADVAFVAAVFGMGALGGARQMYGRELFPSASSSSGCGSSCGSSSSDGGSSGCGGGGGCGGCGG
jgi:uncharacterized protein (TIGR04222 family)